MFPLHVSTQHLSSTCLTCFCCNISSSCLAPDSDFTLLFRRVIHLVTVRSKTEAIIVDKDGTRWVLNMQEKVKSNSNLGSLMWAAGRFVFTRSRKPQKIKRWILNTPTHGEHTPQVKFVMPVEIVHHEGSMLVAYRFYSSAISVASPSIPVGSKSFDDLMPTQGASWWLRSHRGKP